jgi:hypothetical protein
VEVLCDAHTHVRAWIVVRDNPHVVSDDNGQFRTDEIPPGRHRVAARHEGWLVTGKDKDGRPLCDLPRVLAQDVTVPPRGEVSVEFRLR